MGFNVKVDLSNFDKRFSRSNLIRARKLAANDALQAMDKYVPSSTQGENQSGASLRGETAVALDGSYIMYQVPYARAQFYGFITNSHGGPYRIHNYTTPGTSRRWDLRLKGNKQDMQDVMDTFVKGLDWKLK